MDADDIKYRRCSNPKCDYKELRGRWQGGFINGQFVCDPCYFASQCNERQKIITQQEAGGRDGMEC